MDVPGIINLRWVLSAVLIAAFCGCDRKIPNSRIGTEVIARSLVTYGDLTRLERVLSKARRGEPITIGFIGGSITSGEHATAKDRQYADLVARWWVEQFPRTRITMVNAGVPGTNSMYGCLRAQRDLISNHPDFVVVEFGVNDPDKDTKEKPHDAENYAQTYEGLIRQLLADPDQPAVVQLYMMHHDGSNAQKLQSEIGRRYGLPMISFRDAMWPEFTAGRLRQGDYFYDTVHPSDRGHAAIATFITSLLQQTLDHLPPDAGIPTAVPAALPKPCFTDLFEHTTLIDAGDLRPVVNDRWTYDPAHDWWTSNTFGSAIEFDVTGQSVDILYQKQDGGTATALVTVDGVMPLLCSTWLNGWGPLCQVDRVIFRDSSKTHRVRIKLLMGKTMLNRASNFRILGFGTANPQR